MNLSALLTFLHMSDFAIDQQEQKNMEAAQTMEEQLDRATKEAEDAHTAYFALRRTDPSSYNMTQEAILWNRYIKAHRAEQDYLWKKMDKGSQFDVNALAKEMGIDPNDYVETSERTDPTEVLEVEHRECYGLN